MIYLINTTLVQMENKNTPIDLGLNSYLNEEGRIIRLPGKRQKKKLDLMILFFANKFEKEKEYSEAEVNDILTQYHTFNDPATLRRLLIGTQTMKRTTDGRRYWLNVN